MSLVLHISHGFTTKKLSVSKSFTGSQLTQLALDKFGLNGSGQLSHNNKPIDLALPLRLTSLTNNSKLKLEVKESTNVASEVSVKLLIDSKTFIEKVDSGLTLLQVLQKFEMSQDVTIEKDNLQLIILNQVYNDLDVKLGSIVGNTTNLVVRVRYHDPNSTNTEQEKINQLQLERQKERIVRLREERREATEKEERDRLEQAKKEENVEQATGKDLVANPPDSVRDTQQELDDHLTQQQELELANEPPEPAPTPVDHYKFEVPKMEEAPRLYKPAAAAVPAAYENPDDDYNMSVNQLKTYQKIIQNSSKPVKKLKTVPSKLMIRIKFPNREILQINFIHDLPNVKLGQLFKKIDELIAPRFLNNYNLKLGYPPFNKIEMGFDANNQKLIDLPDFNQESIVLIWETSGLSLGPFLKEDAIGDIKLSSELPELVLEQHRGELESEPIKNHHTPVNGTDENNAKSETKKGVPKWFKSK